MGVSRQKQALPLAALLSLAIGSAQSACFAQTQTFTHTARIVMGSRETQDECREFAKVEARRAVLDQVGVYIEGRSDLMQHIRESATGITDETDMQKRVLAIAAGVTQLEVAGEEWKSEGGALVLYLTCRVTVNPNDVTQRLTELVKDRQKVEDYERVGAEVARLREELTRLRADLDSAKNEAQTNAARESVKSTINELTATDWFCKGLAATEPDDRIACFSFAIQLNPNSFLPYYNRGTTYANKGDYNAAIIDLSRALQIDPNLAFLTLYKRGTACAKKGDLERAIADFSQSIQIYPNNALAYYNRGDYLL
jgi:tetratricopeptide (TPR) repeat protein